MLKLVSWNIDGLARALPGPAKGRAQRIPLVELHRALGEPDVLCLQEIRLRPEDALLRESLASALPGFSCGYALCQDRINVTFRGGRAYGVATYVRRALAPRWLEPPAWDREGRVCAFELPQHGLFVANVYAVNGTGKPYFDRDGRVAGDRYAFKLLFQRRLLECLTEVRASGRSLVLAGDWNVSRTVFDVHPRLRTEAPHVEARAMFNQQFIPQLDLCDAFRELHGDVRKYTWFDRMAARQHRLDAARVDYALVSRSLRHAIVSADIAEEQAFALGSDHAPVSLVLRDPVSGSLRDASNPH